MIRVVLPAHLKMLANVSGEVELEVAGTPSPASVIDLPSFHSGARSR